MTVSLVRRCYETETRAIELEEVFDAIRTGAHDLKQRDTQIKNRYESELVLTGSTEKAKKAVAELKMELPGVIYSGIIPDRSTGNVTNYTGLLMADVDNLGEEKARELKEAMKFLPFVRACGISPTGTGLKVLFNVTPDPSRHGDSFRAIQQNFRDSFGVEIDEKCKDITRLHFLFYDPNFWIRIEGNEILPPADPLPKKTFTPGYPTPDINLAIRQQVAIEVAAQYGRVIEWESGDTGWLRPCPGFEAHGNRDGPKDCKLFLLPNDHSPCATFYCVHTSCKGTIEAMNRELRSRIASFELRESTKKTNKDPLTSFSSSPNGEITDLSSLSSSLVKPKMEKEAYYGLAGKIVEQILPFSEADPAALLFQLLTGYGNIIGRKSYCRVGGASHYFNLYVVIVGPTSRGRKGTSWDDIRYHILTDADPPWHGNITGGLSSGEGLISAIKDPVTRERKGEVETIETGVTDKRLMVVEGEFARVLKVMQREQNTLSSVIRTAWEMGNLRTLTKSPYRATGAHVSIIGHITPEELHHWMTEVEMANGFGNRFLWAYTERSKLLPEGARPNDLTDVLSEFKNAVKFGNEPRELSRNEEAKELWAAVYGTLSDDKIGLAGALTARATAQTLRLSGIYALLDESEYITKPHLEAALAAWRYCDRSVHYIFKKGTGNGDSDKILTALVAAGKKGMARWDITNQVFNRNATKLQIDEALRLLARLKYASCKEESTGGRPSQIWFANHEVNEE